MSAAKIETVHRIACEKCGGHFGSIDHLRLGATFGPWSCRNRDCDQEVSGTVTADGADVELTTRDRRGRLFLLKLRDVYIVTRNPWVSADPGDNDDYFIHSHQCPTNLIQQAIEVFDAEGNDPHGIFRLVASKPFTHEAEDKLEEMHSLQELLAFFGTDGAPASTDWPEEDKGVLSFIAKAQREETARRAPKA
ncbi:MAG TPA: hypothetical protein VNF91_09630 [Candidatus Acidoferrum sp.]|nr:hypothetical protein [Candidatus Acidoferrum sp.]